jgi:hypothetical protein
MFSILTAQCQIPTWPTALWRRLAPISRRWRTQKTLPTQSTEIDANNLAGPAFPYILAPPKSF